MVLFNQLCFIGFEYLLGETTVWDIAKDCCNSIRNWLKATEMPEKTE